MKEKKKQKLYYTFIICALMEFLMAYYNYFFHTRAFLHEAFLLALMEFIPAFIIGFLCEWFMISKVAYKVSTILHREHFKDKNIIHINEFLIALGMMLVISTYGALLHNQESGNLLLLIAVDMLKNSIFGIPLFLIVVNPFTKYIIHKINEKD